jgi:hypothetical protein
MRPPLVEGHHRLEAEQPPRFADVGLAVRHVTRARRAEARLAVEAGLAGDRAP